MNILWLSLFRIKWITPAAGFICDEIPWLVGRCFLKIHKSWRLPEVLLSARGVGVRELSTVFSPVIFNTTGGKQLCNHGSPWNFMSGQQKKHLSVVFTYSSHVFRRLLLDSISCEEITTYECIIYFVNMWALYLSRFVTRFRRACVKAMLFATSWSVHMKFGYKYIACMTEVGIEFWRLCGVVGVVGARVCSLKVLCVTLVWLNLWGLSLLGRWWKGPECNS